MRNYWEQTENKDDLERGMFIILSLRYVIFKKSGCIRMYS